MTCLNENVSREAHARRIDSRQEFYEFFTPHNAAKPEIHGGFVMAHWAGDAAAEEKLKTDLSVTIRCIPLDSPDEPGTCPFTLLRQKALWLATGRKGAFGFAGFRKDAPRLAAGCFTGKPSPRRVLFAKAY